MQFMNSACVDLLLCSSSSLTLARPGTDCGREEAAAQKPYCLWPALGGAISPQISDPIRMAGTGRSMLLSLLLFAVTLSLLEMYRGSFASSELMTIAGGFISSLLFLLLLTFIGNYQEASGIKTGWGAVVVAELVALIVAGTVHRVCITTCFLFSVGLLYEVDKLSGMILARSESKARRY